MKNFIYFTLAIAFSLLFNEYLFEKSIANLLNYKFLITLLVGSFICTLVYSKIKKKTL
ncbi:MAG: hypothetical protein LBE34_06590 [Flavobacteriaceae bacterium]|nr:hypothetical protein [Flavobacteriaceae bacterium]